MKNSPLALGNPLSFFKILLTGLMIGSLSSCVQKTGDAALEKYYDHANNAQTTGKDLIDDVTLKIGKIAEEKSTTDNARSYADCSVILAKYGRDNCNWLDGQDSTATDGDPGRGVSEWHDHYAYMRRHPPKLMFGKLVESRMVELEKILKREQFARVYADISIILDRYLNVQNKNN